MNPDLTMPSDLWAPDLFYFLLSLGQCNSTRAPVHYQDEVKRAFRSEFQYRRWAGATENDPEGQVVDYGDWIIFFIAGTPNTVDAWHRNFQFPTATHPGIPGTLHGRFANMASDVFESMTAGMRALNPTDKIIITGHSQGGALAQLVSFLFNQAYPGQVAYVATWGAPKPWVTGTFVPPAWPIIRLENENDPFTALPQGPGTFLSLVATRISVTRAPVFSAVGTGWILNSSGQVYQNEILQSGELRSRTYNVGPNRPLHHLESDLVATTHNMAPYVLRVRANLPLNLAQGSVRLPELWRCDVANGVFTRRDELNRPYDTQGASIWPYPSGYDSPRLYATEEAARQAHAARQSARIIHGLSGETPSYLILGPEGLAGESPQRQLILGRPLS